MKIVARYLTREYIVNLSYCLAAFFMIFLVHDLFDHLAVIITNKTPWPGILKYYLCLIALSSEHLVPASLLLATLYTLWRLSHNNEITAMRASGISLYRIMAPFLVVGMIFVMLTGVLKEAVAPRAGFWAKTFSRNKFRAVDRLKYYSHAYYSSVGSRLWLIDIFDLKNPGRLRGVKVTQEREDGTRVSDSLAWRAEYLDGQWWFHGLQVQKYDEKDNPVGGLVPEAAVHESVREMTQFSEKPSDFAAGVKEWEFLSSLEMLEYIRKHSSLSSRTALHRRFDIHSRLAGPWACLIVTIFGVPAGVRGGRRNALTGIFLAISLFFAFYAVTHVGIFLGKRQIVWLWMGAWLPNLAFLSAGLVMTRRMR